MAEHPLPLEPTSTGYRIDLGDVEALVHARWHAALDDPDRETGPIGDHIRQALAAAEARGAAHMRGVVERLADEWGAIARESRPHLGCLDMHRHLASQLRACVQAYVDDYLATREHE